MPDPVDVFSRQFTPVAGGYLYYPSKNAGGKLVTVDEYEHLSESWAKIAGPRGTRKTVGMIMLALLVWILATKAWPLPDWSHAVFTGLCVTALSARLIHASLAPRRLVKDRPAIAPPRSVAEVKRQARALLNWRSIIFGLLFSGTIFVASLSAPDRNIASWAWLVGSGTILAMSSWVAIQKIRDR